MVVLFSGYDRSGKDSAFKIIKAKMPCQRIAMADRLKEISAKIFGTTESMKGTGAEDYYRLALTRTSEIVKEVAGDLYFPKYLVEKHGLENLCSDRLYICTDGRYDYEIEYFEEVMGRYCLKKGIKHCFFPVKLTRPSVPPSNYSLIHHNFVNYNFCHEIVNEDYDTFEKDVLRFVRSITENA